jgi:hypothetical protein
MKQVGKFEVLTAVKMLIVVFWVMTLCDLVGGYQHFRGKYCLHLQDEVTEGDHYQEIRKFMHSVNNSDIFVVTDFRFLILASSVSNHDKAFFCKVPLIAARF